MLARLEGAGAKRCRREPLVERRHPKGRKVAVDRPLQRNPFIVGAATLCRGSHR